jgi:hypothetical protein
VSRDPWLALEAQRRRRHWKQWPWGLIALGLAVLFTVGMFGLVLIGAASVRPPGDGSSARSARVFHCAAGRELLGAAGCLAAAVLAWRLNRGKVAAGWRSSCFRCGSAPCSTDCFDEYEHIGARLALGPDRAGAVRAAWASLLLGVLAFAASFGSPGDGNHGVQAMQYWIVAALVTLGAVLRRQPGGDGAGLATPRGPSRRRCRCVAGDAGVAGLIVIGSSWG